VVRASAALLAAPPSDEHTGLQHDRNQEASLTIREAGWCGDSSAVDMETICTRRVGKVAFSEGPTILRPSFVLDAEIVDFLTASPENRELRPVCPRA
jgi:hypothetical protein